MPMRLIAHRRGEEYVVVVEDVERERALCVRVDLALTRRGMTTMLVGAYLPSVILALVRQGPALV